MVIKLRVPRNKEKIVEEKSSPLNMPADFNTAPKSMNTIEKSNSSGKEKEIE